jgi:hypothetical protein
MSKNMDKSVAQIEKSVAQIEKSVAQIEKSVAQIEKSVAQIVQIYFLNVILFTTCFKNMKVKCNKFMCSFLYKLWVEMTF